MGDDFNPLIPGIGANMLNNSFKDDSSKGSLPGVAGSIDNNFTSARTPNLFEPYQRFIPEAMNTNSHITDPSAILKAYQTNLPAFMSASSQATPSVQESLSAKQQGK